MTGAPSCAVCSRLIRQSPPGPFGVVWLHVGGLPATVKAHAARPQVQP